MKEQSKWRGINVISESGFRCHRKLKKASDASCGLDWSRAHFVFARAQAFVAQAFICGPTAGFSEIVGETTIARGLLLKEVADGKQVHA